MRETDNGRRLIAIALTTLVHVAAVGLALMSWTHRRASAPAETLSAFDVSTVAAQQPAEEKPADDRPEAAKPAQSPARVQTATPAVQLPVRQPPIFRTVAIARPAIPAAISPPAIKPSAPAPAPSPAPAKVTDPDVNWESRVLAHIDRHKRYPRMIGSRRPEGTVFVVFTLDRQGGVTNPRIERSSGNAALDNEAIATVRRAAPLPPVPDDRQAPVETSVPIEFHHR